MKYSYTVLFCTLLGGVSATNSKLNQYRTVADCNADANIISHASPPEGTCHSVDSATGALYLVTGDGAAGAYFQGSSGSSCGNIFDSPLQENACIALPSGVGSIFFSSEY